MKLNSAGASRSGSAACLFVMTAATSGSDTLTSRKFASQSIHCQQLASKASFRVNNLQRSSSRSSFVAICMAKNKEHSSLHGPQESHAVVHCTRIAARVQRDARMTGLVWEKVARHTRGRRGSARTNVASLTWAPSRCSCGQRQALTCTRHSPEMTATFSVIAWSPPCRLLPGWAALASFDHSPSRLFCRIR